MCFQKCMFSFCHNEKLSFFRDMGSKSSKNSQTSQNDEISIDKKGFNISDTDKNNLETHNPNAMDCSTEKLTKSTSRRKLLTFIYRIPRVSRALANYAFETSFSWKGPFSKA